MQATSAARALDGMFLYENTPTSLTINTISTTEVDLNFTTDLVGKAEPYPPSDFNIDHCVGGTVTSSLTGPWTEFVVQ